MSIRNEQCNKVCRILDDVLANRPTERDALIVAVRKAFDALSESHWIPVTERLPENGQRVIAFYFAEDGGIMTIRYDKCGNWGFKAWMPLPAPYREVTE